MRLKRKAKLISDIWQKSCVAKTLLDGNIILPFEEDVDYMKDLPGVVMIYDHLINIKRIVKCSMKRVRVCNGILGLCGQPQIM